MIQHVCVQDLSFEQHVTRKSSTLCTISPILEKNPALMAVYSEFVWSCMHKYINNWCKLFLDCHQSKVRQHTHALLPDFEVLDCHFNHLHVHIVEELYLYIHCLQQIHSFDRFNYSTKAIPMRDSIAPMCARVVFCG